ncbi:MAG: nucleotidyltransferase domain-containing protein, partial [Halioglobus sp.]|nr:nucleotidyltransferase domain-containing protein [Halioglobus sp.]
MPGSESSLPAQMFDVAALRTGLESDNAIRACRDAIVAATQYQHEQFRGGTQASELIRQRALFVDTLLGLLWDWQQWPEQDMALVAVGGYGRGELHPHSDVDLLILLGQDCESQREKLAAFTAFLWDIGLNPGYSVRNVAECVEQAGQDITVLTNLMETRVIRGPQALMEEVRELTGPDRMWPSAEFFKAKLEEQDDRHERFA